MKWQEEVSLPTPFPTDDLVLRWSGGKMGAEKSQWEEWKSEDRCLAVTLGKVERS